MKISALLEVTAADLFRKIDGLDAMIADPATTAGEKQNAQALKLKLQNRLNTEFPGAQRPNSSTVELDDFWTGMARAAQAQQDLEDLKQNDPAAYRAQMMDRLKKMQSNLANMRKRHVPGDVESAAEIREYARRVDNFIRREFPEKWKEMEAKRQQAQQRSYARADQKRAAKQKAGKEAVKKEQKGTWKTVGRQYAPALNALYDALRGTKFKYGVLGEKSYIYSKVSPADKIELLPHIPTGEIRKQWNQMSSDVQAELRAAVDQVNTQGPKFEGYTTAQKASLLAAMSPYKTK
jgi:hypothetical protein